MRLVLLWILFPLLKQYSSVSDICMETGQKTLADPHVLLVSIS